MRNVDQLKALIKKEAKAKNVQAQAVMQNYMFERLLERISHSEYRDKFILKGGMLIAAMVGLEHRSTMDMDATIRNYPMDEEAIRRAFRDIDSIDLGDGISFTLTRIAPIRKDDAYGGLRISLDARFQDMVVWLSIDVTTNDVITPSAIRYSMVTMFEGREFIVWAYNLETVIAEKYETIIRRGVANTRPRDFYDIHALLKQFAQNIDATTLYTAITATARHRDSGHLLARSEAILEEIHSNKEMNERWQRYAKEYPYVTDIDFSSVLEASMYINGIYRTQSKSKDGRSQGHAR